MYVEPKFLIVNTPNGPLEVMVRPDKSVTVWDHATRVSSRPYGATAKDFVVNRVPLHIRQDCTPNGDGTYSATGSYGSIDMRYAKNYNDRPSFKTQEKAQAIIVAALAESHDHILKILPGVVLEEAAAKMIRCNDVVSKAHAALAEAEVNRVQAVDAYNVACRGSGRADLTIGYPI